MMVIFLVGLVSMILMRTLRKDYARYNKEEDLDDMVRFRVYLIMIKKSMEVVALRTCMPLVVINCK